MPATRVMPTDEAADLIALTREIAWKELAPPVADAEATETFPREVFRTLGRSIDRVDPGLDRGHGGAEVLLDHLHDQLLLGGRERVERRLRAPQPLGEVVEGELREPLGSHEGDESVQQVDLPGRAATPCHAQAEVPAPAPRRSTNRWILPLGVLGSSSTKCTVRG